MYCNALFGISLFCSKADINLLLGLSPVLISGYDTVNSRPKRWDVGSRILMILYPIHQPYSHVIRRTGFSRRPEGLTRSSNLYENLLFDLIRSWRRSNHKTLRFIILCRSPSQVGLMFLSLRMCEVRSFIDVKC